MFATALHPHSSAQYGCHVFVKVTATAGVLPQGEGTTPLLFAADSHTNASIDASPHELSLRRVSSATRSLLEHGGEEDDGAHADSILGRPAPAPPTVLDDDAPLGFSPWRKRFRAFFLRATWLHRLFMAAILFNCVLLGFYNPKANRGDGLSAFSSTTRNEFVQLGDIMCTLFYVVEMVCKVVALGVHGYVKRKWNLADGVIAICGIVSLFPATGSLDVVKLIRPLKLLNASTRMEVIMNSLGAAISELFYVAVLYFFFSLAMGIIAVQQWEGLLRARCVLSPNANVTAGVTPPSVYAPDTICRPRENFNAYGGFYCPYNYDCVHQGNPGDGWLSFDHIWVAMLTLFVGISLEGWTASMYHTMDATTNFALIFWLILILLGSYFLMNLTLLIIAETFNSTVVEKGKQRDALKRAIAAGKVDSAAAKRDFYLEQAGVEDTSFYHAKKRPANYNLYEEARYEPAKPWTQRVVEKAKRAQQFVYEKLTMCGEKTRPHAYRERVYDVVLKSPWFHRFIICSIIVNTVALSAQYHGQPREVTIAFDVVNLVITVVFTLEVALKLYVGMRSYLKDPFNVLDLVIVIAGVLELGFQGGQQGGSSISALRSLRVLRVLRLATYFRQLQKWLHILLSAIRNVLYIVIILALLVYLGAIWGMRLFGGRLCLPSDAAVNATAPAPCVAPRANYDTLHTSILATFQIITGENWNEIMYSAMRQTSWLSVVYFLGVFVTGHYLVLNLFVAVLLCKNGEPLMLNSSSGATDVVVRAVSFSHLSAMQLEDMPSEAELRTLLLAKGVRRSLVQQLGEGVSGRIFAELDDDTLQQSCGIRCPAWRDRLLRLGNQLRSDAAEFACYPMHIAKSAGNLHHLLSTIYREQQVEALKRRQRGTRRLRSYTLGGLRVDDDTEGAAPVEMAVISENGVQTEKPAVNSAYAIVGNALLYDERTLLSAVASYSDDPRLLQHCLVTKYPRYATAIRDALRTWITAHDTETWELHSVAVKVKEIVWHATRPARSVADSAKTQSAQKRKARKDEAAYLRHIQSLVEAYQDCPNLLASHLTDKYLLEKREVSFLEDWRIDRRVRDGSYREYYRMLAGFEKSQNAWYNKLQLAKTDNSFCVFPRCRATEPTDGWLKRKMRSALYYTRLAVTVVSEHVLTEMVVVVTILISTVCLAVDTPMRPPDHPVEVTLEMLQYVTLWVFVVEALLKCIAYGVVLHEDAYLRRNAWNRLDFFITFTSVLGEFIPELGHMDLHRVLRMLRPLRFINKVQGVKVVFTAILHSMPPLLNVTVISLVVWLVFAIVGLQQFNGKFHRCSDKQYGDVEGAAAQTRAACLDAGYTWRNNPANFDNIGRAFLTLFQVASLEGWPTIMYLSVDAVSYEDAPEKDRYPVFSYYYVVFIIFGSFLILNLFIGVLIDTFSAQKQAVGGSIILSPGQERWVRTHQEMLSMVTDGLGKEMPEDLTGWRAKLHTIVTSRRFDFVIAGCISLNILAMALEHYPSSSTFDTMINVMNDFMLGVFFIEVVLKVVAFGPKRYLGNMWCRFDLMVVLVSAAPVIVVGILHIIGRGDGEVKRVSEFRAIQLIRILRMMRTSRGVTRMLKTFFLSLPSLFNVSAVLTLLLFVYSVCQPKSPSRSTITPHRYWAFVFLPRPPGSQDWIGTQTSPTSDPRFSCCSA